MIKIPQTVSYDKIERQYELDVAGAYYITVPQGWVMKERFIEPDELICVTKGSFRISVNGKKYKLGASDVFIAKKYAVMSGSVVGDEPCSFYSVSFDSTIEKYSDLYMKVIHLASRSSYAESLFNNLYYFCTRGSEHEFLGDSALALLMETIYESSEDQADKFRIHGIIDYINNHMNTSLNIEEIGGEFHYSHDYIGRLFKEEFNVTLKQYIIQRKLAVAKRLLTTSDMPVSQVGEAVGFTDISLFEKFFKYHVGQTPRRFRKSFK